MIARVITLMDSPKSVASAQRCIESGKKFGVEVERLHAATPKHSGLEMEMRRFPTGKFHNKWNRPGPAMGCFLSHYDLWLVSCLTRETVLILEHDAVFVGAIPEVREDEIHLVNLGKPSFGRFSTSEMTGIQTFFSNPRGYLKGAHAYLVTPKAASRIASHCNEAEPVDLFLNNRRFPFMTEVYPWPVECHDDFSTIQNEEGCRAKHRKVRPV